MFITFFLNLGFGRLERSVSSFVLLGKGTIEDKMVGEHHQLNGHEFEETLGDSKGQGSLVCYNSRGHKESGMI